MSFSPARGLLTLLLLLGLLLLLPRTKDEGSQDVPAAATEEIRSSSVPGPDPRAPELPLPPPDIDPSLRRNLDRLRTSYLQQGSKPNRFRLQQMLDELWGSSPPVGLLIHESTDPRAPDGYRRHFSHRLRNFGKTASPSTRLELAAKIRDALGSDPSRSHLAGSLIAFDESPQSIRRVDDLISTESSDAGSAVLLASLAQSRTPQAKASLWKATRRFAASPDNHPVSLMTTIPPLAREADLDVEQVLVTILSATTSFPLFDVSLQNGFSRMPGPAAFEVIAVAHQHRERFSAAEQQRIDQRIAAGIAYWRKKLTARQPHLSTELQELESFLR